MFTLHSLTDCIIMIWDLEVRKLPVYMKHALNTNISQAITICNMYNVYVKNCWISKSKETTYLHRSQPEFFLPLRFLEHFLTVRTQGLVSRQRPEVRRYMPYRIQQKSSRSSELLNKLCRMKELLALQQNRYTIMYLSCCCKID